MTRTVLFLCPHNAAKSVIAAALFDRAAAARSLDFRADSAGTEPDARAAPAVVALLAGEGLDVSGHRPRRVSAQDLARAWRVVSLGCDLSGIAVAPPDVEQWDPVPAPSQDLAGARRVIGERVQALVAALGRVERA